MFVDVKFFDNIVRIMETDNNILRKYQDKCNVTEAWLHMSDVAIKQCKEILMVEKYNESRDAVFNDIINIVNTFDMDEFNKRMIEAQEVPEFDLDFYERHVYKEAIQ